MPPKDKKTAILDAAILCISKYGIEKTNTHSVAKELGVVQSGVHYHFPKQEQLFDSLIHRIVAVNHALVSQMQEKAKAEKNLARLKIYIKGNLIWAAKHPEHVAVLLYSVMRTSHSPSMKKMVTAVLGVGEQTIYSLLAAGAVEREFSVEGEVREMAKFIHGSLIGAIVQYHHARPARSHLYFYKLLSTKLDSLVASP